MPAPATEKHWDENLKDTAIAIANDKDKLDSFADDNADSTAASDEAHEVFKVGVGDVEFRNVSWHRAALLFVKIQFAMSILAVPEALAALGAVGGGLSIVAWTAVNTCTLE